MTTVTIINRLAIRPGKMDEFIAAQRRFSAGLPACGLVGGRMYRSEDGRSAVLVSTFESKQAQEDIMTGDAFKAHVQGLQSFVESSSPAFFEEAYTTGDF
jgi:heme-degrading monooxygenase HmoA